MTPSSAERNQIENEMIFRRSNEKAADDLENLEEMLTSDGHTDLVHDKDVKLFFKCECSDENCVVRIPMSLLEYEKIHTDRDTFVVVPDHQVEPIEKVLKRTTEYNVVKKNNTVAEPTSGLNTTSVDNA